MKNQIDNQWSGHVTVENISDILEVVKSILDGKKYAFAASVGCGRIDVRVNQKVDHAGATSKNAFGLWYEKDVKSPTYAGFNVVDTYGVWGLSTGLVKQPYIAFEYNKMRIEQLNGYGDTIHWTIAVQD